MIYVKHLSNINRFGDRDYLFYSEVLGFHPIKKLEVEVHVVLDIFRVDKTGTGGSVTSTLGHIRKQIRHDILENIASNGFPQLIQSSLLWLRSIFKRFKFSANNRFSGISTTFETTQRQTAGYIIISGKCTTVIDAAYLLLNFTHTRTDHSTLTYNGLYDATLRKNWRGKMTSLRRWNLIIERKASLSVHLCT